MDRPVAPPGQSHTPPPSPFSHSPLPGVPPPYRRQHSLHLRGRRENPRRVRPSHRPRPRRVQRYVRGLLVRLFLTPSLPPSLSPSLPPSNAPSNAPSLPPSLPPGSDVFGSDICTCRPYLIHAIEECIKTAVEGGTGREGRRERRMKGGREGDKGGKARPWHPSATSRLCSAPCLYSNPFSSPCPPSLPPFLPLFFSFPCSSWWPDDALPPPPPPPAPPPDPPATAAAPATPAAAPPPATADPAADPPPAAPAPALAAAAAAAAGVIVYYRKEGRALGEVTKYLVYNMRKRQEGAVILLPFVPPSLPPSLSLSSSPQCGHKDFVVSFHACSLPPSLLPSIPSHRSRRRPRGRILQLHAARGRHHRHSLPGTERRREGRKEGGREGGRVRTLTEQKSAR